MSAQNHKNLLAVLNGQKPQRVPFWLMRQAGRYLPEYRELRSYAGSFLDLVYDSDKAAEVTIQPLRRFGMDGAILFSDILIVPHALGQALSFRTGEGPKLDPVYGPDELNRLSFKNFDAHCAPIYETVSKVRAKMAAESFDETTLIGFCGSPWTVICYMVSGGGSRDFEAPRRWALRDPVTFQTLVDIVTEASIRYLEGQIQAGAEVLQLFDSWSGVLDAQEFRRWVIAPTAKIVSHLRTQYPHIPIIGFPRGAGTMTVEYVKETGVQSIGLDHMTDPQWAVDNLQSILPVQGNLDPVRLLTGGAALEEGLARIEGSLAKGPFIFNLGHGVIKETEIEHVTRLSDVVRGWKI